MSPDDAAPGEGGGSGGWVEGGWQGWWERSARQGSLHSSAVAMSEISQDSDLLDCSALLTLKGAPKQRRALNPKLLNYTNESGQQGSAAESSNSVD